MNTTRTVIRAFIYGNSFTALVRIVLGALFIYSGSVKMLDIEAFGRVITLYGILPEILVPYAAILLPALELVLGLMLFTGYRIKASTVLSTALLAVFTMAIGTNLAWGKSFDCGCFELSRFGISEEISAVLILRNIFIILMYVLVFNVRKHVMSIDSFIEKRKLSRL